VSRPSEKTPDLSPFCMWGWENIFSVTLSKIKLKNKPSKQLLSLSLSSLTEFAGGCEFVSCAFTSGTFKLLCCVAPGSPRTLFPSRKITRKRILKRWYASAGCDFFVGKNFATRFCVAPKAKPAELRASLSFSLFLHTKATLGFSSLVCASKSLLF
jgi:hypothetical protein